MRKVAATVSLLVTAALTACASPNTDVEPAFSRSLPGPAAYLPRSHSHNDYDQKRPLVDALERGFASIEVDVMLMDGELRVGHGEEDVEPTGTLAGLYLDPLRDIARRNICWVYAPSDPPLQLLIDVKSEADATYRALLETLDRYADILTTWTGESPRRGPVTVVLSGNRAIGIIAGEGLRYAAIDGRIGEDRSTLSPEAMPIVSVDWEKLKPSGRTERLATAQSLVAQLHSEGRKVRFWGTPEREDLWRSLVAMDVDYIGTDDVGRLDRLLRAVGNANPRPIDD